MGNNEVNQIDLNQFMQWQKEGKRRSVSIELGEPMNRDSMSIWVYDYDLSVGQHVTSVDEIDLERIKEEEDFAQYFKLKKKFEGDKNE